jgi:LysM domain
MPQQKPNQLARVVAVAALGVAFLVVIVTIASSGGDSNDGSDSANDGETVENTGPTPKGERALEAGVWIVGEGDTLVSISEETGIDLDELVELNPDIDPQALIEGQRISLRAGTGGQDSSSEDTGTEVDAGDTPSSGTGEGDGGPSGTTTNPSIGVD